VSAGSVAWFDRISLQPLPGSPPPARPDSGLRPGTQPFGHLPAEYEGQRGVDLDAIQTDQIRTDVSESPKGQPQENGPSPSGENRASGQPPGEGIAYIVHLAPVIAVMVMMPSTAADRHRHKDAGVSTDRNR
jgi:hypothetical protein